MGMKYLKMYEGFQEEDIREICRGYNITNYTINNGLVDVDGNVDLGDLGELYEIPLRFGIVTGDFDCSSNSLYNLEGSPVEVGGDFYCNFNNLTTLEGGPNKVFGHFYGSNNNLTNLKGCPKESIHYNFSQNFLRSLEGISKKVYSLNCSYNNKLFNLAECPYLISGPFYCTNTPVEEIYYLFPSHESFVDSLDYDYFRTGNKINKIRLTQALLELGKKCPENIKGYVWE